MFFLLLAVQKKAEGTLCRIKLSYFLMDKKFWNDRKINDMTLISIFSCSETKKGYCRKENKSDFIVVVKVD